MASLGHPLPLPCSSSRSSCGSCVEPPTAPVISAGVTPDPRLAKACARVCVRARLRACVRACVRAC
eukprot:12607454-Alexandrium_andersonii.AAC.1